MSAQVAHCSLYTQKKCLKESWQIETTPVFFLKKFEIVFKRWIFNLIFFIKLNTDLFKKIILIFLVQAYFLKWGELRCLEQSGNRSTQKVLVDRKFWLWLNYKTAWLTVCLSPFVDNQRQQKESLFGEMEGVLGPELCSWLTSWGCLTEGKSRAEKEHQRFFLHFSTKKLSFHKKSFFHCKDIFIHKSSV